MTFAAGEEVQTERAMEVSSRQQQMMAQFQEDPSMAELVRTAMNVSTDAYFDYMMTSAVKGLLSTSPPGTSLQELFTDDNQSDSEGQ